MTDQTPLEGEPSQGEAMSDGQLRPGDLYPKRLAEELDRLIERVQAATPDYVPPSFSPQALIELLEKNMRYFSPEVLRGILGKLRASVREDLFDADTWKGLWYMLNYSLEYQSDMIMRRLTGDYETDEWGFDSEMLQVAEPFLTFMYKTYWRVETTGMEHIPEAGRALLVCNHSGQLPWDGAMVGTAIYNEHPNRRIVRTLYATLINNIPFLASILVKLGQVLADEENGVRLLEQGQLVSVFPEGFKGIGKLFKDRYRLARFGRGGFVRMALKTGAPMIPVAIVGAEEIYISLSRADSLARLMGLPYIPITLTWPLLGPLGLVPLPTKWSIDFGEPILTEQYSPQAADNMVLVSQLTDQVRNIVQDMILARLSKRQSVFFG